MEINMYDDIIVEKVCDTLIRASSVFLPDKIKAYERAIANETNEHAKWTLEIILKNSKVAGENKSPLCDDTGIPHLVLEVGPQTVLTGQILESIKEGVRQGLKKLPGRPMAVKGDDYHRLEQSVGLEEDPAALEVAPILIRNIKEDILRLHILMFGGGPAIRGKTYRIFHKHNTQNILDEIVEWATEGTALLGCTPCTIAVGIGRSQYEASSMMLQALVDGTYDKQNAMEQEITRRVNESGVGALGLGGKHTVLATFMKIGPQRASGIRVVCMRPCCCFEPRIASVDL